MSAIGDDPYPPGFEPFVAAIQADIDADLPRLAFADWLDDHGDPDRAEFIRLQCRFTRWDSGTLSTSHTFQYFHSTPAEKKVVGRLSALFSANRLRWLAGIPETDVRPQAAQWTDFQRGFVGRFRRTAAAVLSDGWATLRRITPVEFLSLSEVGRAEARLFHTDRLTGVAVLSSDRLGAAAIRGLIDAPVLPSLRELYLFGKGTVDPAVWAALLGSPAVAGLQTLRVCGFRPADGVAAALAASPSLRRLTDLALIANRLTPAGLERLVSSPAFAAVRELGLTMRAVNLDGLRVLVNSPHAIKLDRLDLSWCGLGPTAAQLLAGWPGLGSVRVLHVHRNPFGVAGLQALGESPHAERLESVWLPDVATTEEQGRAIRALPVFARLRKLDGGPTRY